MSCVFGVEEGILFSKFSCHIARYAFHPYGEACLTFLIKTFLKCNTSNVLGFASLV